MDNHLDFTFDPVNYPLAKVQNLVGDLHAHDQRYVVIVDPGISNQQPSGTYSAYDEGTKLGVWITNPDGTPYVGQVWPGVFRKTFHLTWKLTVFPDFFHPAAPGYWQNQIAAFHKVVSCGLL